MSQRPRSHQLEDISRRRFRDLLPAQWVCRDKDQDYGVDLEVEVFDAAGLSTGYTFNVQLKATDSASHERSVPIETDRIKYLSSLDAPAIIARYCAATDTTRWQWVFNAFGGVDLTTKTVTLSFDDDDIWGEHTAAQIGTTLKVLRRIRAPDRRVGFPLMAIHQSSPRDALVVEQAIEAVFERLPYCRPRASDDEAIQVRIISRPGEIGLALDVVSSFRFKLDRLEVEEVTDCILYGLAAILDHYAFRDQAILAARSCLRRGRPSHSRGLAGIAASCLESEPSDAVALAVLNGIQDNQDEDYSRFLLGLLGSEVSDDEKAEAVQEFFRHAIEAHERSGGVAAIYYSLGNSLSGIGKRADAFRAFNKARKEDPAYLGRAYFLAELAGVLYLAMRFRASARVYAEAAAIEPSSRLRGNLGDALFFSGRHARAAEEFQGLVDDLDEMLASNARLKLRLLDWVREEMAPVDIADGHGWARFTQDHYERGEHHAALHGQLMVAFLGEWDTDVWSGAILLAASVPEIFRDVLHQAYWRCGTQPYERFRAQAESIGMPGHFLDELDMLALEIHSAARTAPDRPIVRMMG